MFFEACLGIVVLAETYFLKPEAFEPKDRRVGKVARGVYNASNPFDII